MVFNSRGMTLVQTLMTVALSTVSLLAIAGIMAQTYSSSKDLDIQALMDTRHEDVLHRASSLKFLRKQFNISDLGVSSLEKCLKSSGSQCNSLAKSSAQTLQDPQGDFNANYGVSLGKCSASAPACVVKQSAKYNWVCSTNQECQELVIDIVTDYQGPEKRRIFQARKSQLRIPARSLLSRGDIDFSCTGSGMLMGVDYKNLKALCSPISGKTQTALSTPAKTIGPNIDAVPGASNCGSGLSQLNLFSSLSNCNGPTAASAPPASTAPVCTPTLMAELNAILVQTFNRGVSSIANNCIDSVNPTLADNMPTTPESTLRFKNTCGNRQCQGMGFTSGRVIEINSGSATLECRYDKAPAGTTNPCASLLTGPAAPMSNFTMSQVQLQTECIDSANPTVAANDPANSPAAAARFVLTCGNRACLSRGFSDGRVVEYYGGVLTLECYNDLTGIFKSATASVNDVATNCIDSANPTLADNLPSAGGSAQDRFLSTCGNRYCAKLGYQSGSVKEYNNGVASLLCL